MTSEKQQESKRDQKYFINVCVPKKTFEDVNKRAHKLEKNRSEYMRGLIDKDLRKEENE